MNNLLPAKVDEFAKIIEGRSVQDPRFEVNIKGTVLGFPATLQAIKASWPFGVTYTLETQVIDDPNNPPQSDALMMTISPRYARGFFSGIARILLIEPHGQPLSDKRFEQWFMCSYNTFSEADRFVKYPGVFESLHSLERCSKFTELTVKAHAGLVLAQPQNFRTLNADVLRETFRLLSELGQVLFEVF